MIRSCVISAVNALLWGLFASSLSLDCSASRMSSKGLCLCSQWWREQKTRNFVKNHCVEGGFLEFHSTILCYSFQWLLTTSYLVLPTFSSVSFLQSLWDLLFILFFNYQIVIRHLVKWDLRTNEVESVSCKDAIWQDNCAAPAVCSCQRGQFCSCIPCSIPTLSFHLVQHIEWPKLA